MFSCIIFNNLQISLRFSGRFLNFVFGEAGVEIRTFEVQTCWLLLGILLQKGQDAHSPLYGSRIGGHSASGSSQSQIQLR